MPHIHFFQIDGTTITVDAPIGLSVMEIGVKHSMDKIDGAWIYKTTVGAQPVVKYVMTKDAATQVWSKTASVATLASSYGLTRTVYYGYRAWGPNWPYVSTWVKGSSTDFISDIDASGNRFNPNKLLLDVTVCGGDQPGSEQGDLHRRHRLRQRRHA